VKETTDTSGKFLSVIFIATLMIGVISGCVEIVNPPIYTIRRLFGVPEGLTETQTEWILIGETILVVFLALLIVLLIALFNRYRKTEKRAIEAGIRERILVRENEVLDRLNRTKTEFFQNMSHDFKTPLTVISTSILNAVDLLDYEMNKEEMRDSLNLAQSEIMRMSRIVDGALRHAALHSNRQIAEQVDLALLLRKVVKTYHAFLERNGNGLSISIPNSLPYVYGNSDTLLNVFSNLITNANRHTRRGRIRIYAEIIEQKRKKSDSRKFVSVTVSDNGTGVNPEIIDNIFLRGASESGTGLGLSICKTAIEAYGGTIIVNSKPGKGTRVTFTVPVYEYDMTDDEENDEMNRRAQ